MKRHLFMGVAPALALMFSQPASLASFGHVPEVEFKPIPTGGEAGRAKSKRCAAHCQRAAKKRRAVKRARRLGHA